MLKRVHFPSSPLPYLLVAPQIIITIIFFIWPASQAMYQSLLIEDAFGLSQEFVWFENFEYLAQDEQYLGTFWRTIFFSICVASLSMGFALLLAGFADRVVRGALAYRTLLIWPYAVAPVLAGALWMFMFNPTLGIFPYILEVIGYDWNHYLNGHQAMFLVILAAAWKHASRRANGTKRSNLQHRQTETHRKTIVVVILTPPCYKIMYTHLSEASHMYDPPRNTEHACS